MSKVQALIELAGRVARELPGFFERNGPGVGNKLSNKYMRRLRDAAEDRFQNDYSEQRICGENGLKPDFYFPDERTIIEIALSLRNSNSEFERDILKALLAKGGGCEVGKLVFISRPGGASRHKQASSRAFLGWLRQTHGIEVAIHDLQP